MGLGEELSCAGEWMEVWVSEGEEVNMVVWWCGCVDVEVGGCGCGLSVGEYRFWVRKDHLSMVIHFIHEIYRVYMIIGYIFDNNIR